MDDGSGFGQAVKELREERGWKRADLLRAVKERGLDMYPTTLQRIEDGKQIARIHEAVALSTALDVRLDHLATGVASRLATAVITTEERMDDVFAALDRWREEKSKLLDWTPDEVDPELANKAMTLNRVSAVEIARAWQYDAHEPEWWQVTEDEGAPDGTA